jgi:hypothetical protein
MGLRALATAVARAKQNYQACRYSEVMSQLPGLLADLQVASDNLDSDARRKGAGWTQLTLTTSSPAFY